MEYDDLDDTDDVTIDCSQCGRSFYEDAPQCPYCGHIPLEGQRQRPAWVIGIILVMIGAMAWPFFIWLLGTFRAR